MKKKIIFGTGVLLYIVLLIFLILIKDSPNSFKTDYRNMKLDGINKLMIVAHPDDEILWSGTNLIQDDYLVVCVTCGKSNPKRVYEFENVMSNTGEAYIMLDYPDKTNGERDRWVNDRENIIEDLKNIYNLKEWQEVITHNPEGEYGHIHHQMISEFVTEFVNKDVLKYFGKYYSKKKLEKKNIKLPKIDDDLLSQKEELLKLYVTQKKTIEGFSHMIAAEDILSYKKWKEKYNEKN